MRVLGTYCSLCTLIAGVSELREGGTYKILKIRQELYIFLLY